jgi:hypothetical protein
MSDTLLDVVNRVRRVIGLGSVTSFVEANESLDNVQDVNDSYLYLLKQLPDDLPMLQDLTGGSLTTVAGTRTYALDSDARPFYLMEWSFADTSNENRALSWATKEYVQKRDPNYKTNQGQPELIYLDGTTFGIYPVPDDAYTITYDFKSPFTRLSGTTDTFLIPDEWLRFVELHSVFLYEQRKGFGNVETSVGRVQDEMISIVAEAELMSPSYFQSEVYY